MKKNNVIFLVMVAVGATCIQSYAQNKIMPIKTPLSAPNVVNFTDLAKYELAHPPVKKEHFIPQAGDKNKNAKFEPQPVPANAIKFNITPLRSGGVGNRSRMKKHSPMPASSFNGIMDDGARPPDISGVAGNTYLMETTNGQFNIYSKTGSLVNSLTPGGFFSAYGPELNLTDVHCIYDMANNRYLIVMMGNSNLSDSGGVYLGISQTDDPTGNWWVYFYDAYGHRLIPYPPFIWDYPLIGYNSNWVVVTIGVGGTLIYAFNRDSLYNGLYHSTVGTVNTFRYPTSPGNLGPALTYDPTEATEYLVQNLNGNSDGYGYVQICTITGTVTSPVFTVTTPIGVPSPWNDNNSIAAPQSGGSQTLAGGDTRINDAIYVNSSLWFCHAVMLPASSPTHSAVDWWQINPITPSIMQFGRVEDITGSNFYFYPSINVNSNGDALLGYCQSSPTIYASAAYSIHASIDPTDTMESSNRYKPGFGYYDNVGTGGNRWGDFTGAAVDPVDGSFWNFSQWANTGNQWGTVIANIRVPHASDLYSQDDIADSGIEPNPSTVPMYQSQDIWLRQMPDPTFTYAHMTEDAQYPGTNYVYVEVRNRGNAPSSGTELITLYWAKGASMLSWPTSWNGDNFFDSPTNTMLMGAQLGTQIIPVIPAKGSTILTFSWTVPNPSTYSLPMFTGDENHFCLLSRIFTSTSAPFGMSFPETADLYQNVQDNNKIAWKNIEVFDLSHGSHRATAHAVVGNLTNAKMKVKFRFTMLDADGNPGFLNKGKLEVTAEGKLKDILKGHISGDGIKETGQGTFEVNKDGATLENIYLEPKDMGAFEINFVPNDSNEVKKGFAINFTQIEDLNGMEHIIGGQTFVYGQVKGLGTSPSNTGATSFWHWWYWFIILIILLIVYFMIRRK